MPDCNPVASCADTAPADAALAALRALDVVGSSCHALPGGELLECGEHYRVLQAYHDGCEGIERTSTAVRDGFHSYAARCERSGCNSLSRYSDPNSEVGCAPRRSGATQPAAAAAAANATVPLLVLLLLVLLVAAGGVLARRALAARGLVPVLCLVERVVTARTWQPPLLHSRPPVLQQPACLGALRAQPASTHDGHVPRGNSLCLATQVLSAAWPWVRILPVGAAKARAARPATHALLEAGSAASTTGAYAGAAVAPAREPQDSEPHAAVAAGAELTQPRVQPQVEALVGRAESETV